MEEIGEDDKDQQVSGEDGGDQQVCGEDGSYGFRKTEYLSLQETHTVSSTRTE